MSPLDGGKAHVSVSRLTLRARATSALVGAFPLRYPVIPPGAKGRVWPRWAALALIVAAYLPLFGPTDFNGIVALVTREVPPWTVENDSLLGAQVYHLLQNLGPTILVVVFSMMVIRVAGLSWADAGLDLPRTRNDWRRQGLAFLAASGALMGGVLFGLPLPGGLGHFPFGGAWLYEFGASFLAGFQEELPLTVLLVVLLRLVGMRWLWIVLLACAFRVVFHLYYGPQAALAIAVWIPVTLLVYQRLGSVWAIVAAHSLQDLGATAGDLGTTLLHHSHMPPGFAQALLIVASVVAVFLPVCGLSTSIAVVARDLWKSFRKASGRPTNSRAAAG